MKEIADLFNYYDRLKIQIEEEIQKRLEQMRYLCPHCKKDKITIHYKEPYRWLIENKENNTFTLNVLFFCSSCYEKFEGLEKVKTGE